MGRWLGGKRPLAVGAQALVGLDQSQDKQSNLLPAHRRELALAPERYQALGLGVCGKRY